MSQRWRTACVTVAMALLMGGCAGAPSGISPPDQSSRQRQTDATVQEAKAESAALRAELAAARIAAAKQEAELRELRRQVEELRQAVDAKHAELIELRNERDRLAQAATIAQVRVAEPPPSAVDVAGLRARLQEMESALAALTAELAQVRQDVTQLTAISKSKPAPARSAQPRSP